MKIIELRPPRIAIALTFFATLFHWLIRSEEHFRLSFPWLGVSLGAAGLCIMLWAWWLFRKKALAICPTAATASIVTYGPYRFSRHPMYLGMVIMMAGIAVYIGTAPFYVAALVYFLVLNFVFCPYEERKLIGAFGGEYTDYTRRVRRWL
jgi:protein-S-isoprenylcysteine O-methyltransferase Ste14